METRSDPKFYKSGVIKMATIGEIIKAEGLLGGVWSIFLKSSPVIKILIIVAIGVLAFILFLLFKIIYYFKQKTRCQWRIKRIKGKLQKSSFSDIKESKAKESDKPKDVSYRDNSAYVVRFYGIPLKLDMLAFLNLLLLALFITDSSVRRYIGYIYLNGGLILMIIIIYDYICLSKNKEVLKSS